MDIEALIMLHNIKVYIKFSPFHWISKNSCISYQLDEPPASIIPHSRPPQTPKSQRPSRANEAWLGYGWIPDKFQTITMESFAGFCQGWGTGWGQFSAQWCAGYSHKKSATHAHWNAIRHNCDTRRWHQKQNQNQGQTRPDQSDQTTIVTINSG